MAVDPLITPFELRSIVHDVLHSKQAEIDQIRARHEIALQATYRMTAGTESHGSFPDIETDVTIDESSNDGYDAWRKAYVLEAGPSRITKLRLPTIPPLSPPPTATIFPDDPITPPRQSISLEHTDSVGSTINALPHRRPSPERTIKLDQIQTPHRPFSGFSPPPKHALPDWIPSDNYHPADTPLEPPTTSLVPFVSDYTSTLPRLPPIDQPNKRRKASKSHSERRKDLTELSYEYKLNPLSGSLSKSSKCLSTEDWKLAAMEMRHVRAMERIEQKKQSNRWSLRQPKKLRGPTVPKAHWDYLLDEMEWMRTDFAEERRWKFVQAREFAYQCVEWHLASAEEKASLMVGGRAWGARVEAPRGDTAQPVEQSAEDDVEMLIQPEDDDTTASVDPAQPTGTQVLDEIMADPPDPVVKQEREEIAIEAPPVEIGEEDADGEADADGEDDAEGEAEDGVVGLEDIPTTAPEEPEPSARQYQAPPGIVLHKRFQNADHLLAARRPLLELAMEVGTVDTDAALLPKAPSQPENDTAPLLSELFPDLGVYGGPIPPSEGKVHKRHDEGQTSVRQIAHTSRLLDIQPVFVSHLCPAQNYKDGSWDVRTGPWYEDPKGSTDVPEEVLTSQWGFISGRHARPLNPKHAPSVPNPDDLPLPSAIHKKDDKKSESNEGRVPRYQHIWTEEEDVYLLRLVEKYPWNWTLIADSLNSELNVIPTDRVIAYDCWDRWYWTFGDGKNRPRPINTNLSAPTPGASAAPAQSAGPATAPATNGPASMGETITAAPVPATPVATGTRPPATPIVDTPGGITVPTLPMQNGEDGAPPPPGLSKREAKAAGKHKYEGTKKSVRHQVLYDSMRRLVRRREQAKTKTAASKEPKRVITVHESHSIYLNNQINTPFEMVEIKHQKDVRDARERQMRVQQMQDARAQVMRQQATLVQQQQQAQAQAQQQQQQQQQGQMPHQQVPQPQPGQPQMRPPPQQGQIPMPNMPNGQQRMPSNGQAMPNMAPSQQQLLTAVAAANAARQGGPGSAPNGTPGNAVRPLPSGQGQPPNPQMQQQMQMLQAQQIAARQAAQVQQNQNRAQAAGETPRSNSNTLSASPYQHPGGELPNGEMGIMQGSPAMAHMSVNPHSSPLNTAPQLNMGRPMPPAHLRVASGGSPQMGGPVPPPQQAQAGQGGAGGPSQAMMQQIVTQLQANGQQPSPEGIRAIQQQIMRNVAAQAQAQAAQAQAQAQQGGQMMPNQQVPPHFNRSPSIQNIQAQPRGSPASQ